MSERNDGGPAFPCATDQVLCSPNADGPAKIQVVMRGGMSLRDYFAAKAMAAILSSPRRSVDSNGKYADSNQNVLAAMAYTMADAMLRAREVKQ